MSKNKTTKGLQPTEDELFYLDWGKETVKENISVINEMFKLFITLDASILSAYLAFYDKINISPIWLKTAPLVFVTTSLIVSIIGIYPTAQKINLLVLTKSKNTKKSEQNKKVSFFCFPQFFLYLDL